MEYLDSRPLVGYGVRYGALGLHGDLGYEGQAVQVRGKAYSHALSAHAPLRLVFELEGKYQTFQRRVALNDDVPE